MKKDFVLPHANGRDMAIDVVNFCQAPSGYDLWWDYRYYMLMDLPEDLKKEIGYYDMKPKVYIAGPMSGLPELNYPEFHKAEDFLKVHYEVINPARFDIEQSGDFPDGFDIQEVIKRDLDELSKCNYIYMLKGWENSKGARAEHAVALWHGIEVLFQEDTAKERKATPVFSGVLKYFPDAIQEVARCSHIGNEQHHPGTALHWDRAKSTDELDALVRHLMEAGEFDTDGVRHSTKVAWRALANLQKELEK